MSEEKWTQVQQFVPIPCVDVLPWALTEDGPRILLIRRLDERGEPRWALVGGRVNLDETLQEAVARHLRTTLGNDLAWSEPGVDHPDAVAEYLRVQRAGYGFDPRKHAVALTYIVEINGEVTPQGEAIGAEYFAVDSPPPPDEIGFGQAHVLYKLLQEVGKNRDQEK